MSSRALLTKLLLPIVTLTCIGSPHIPAAEQAIGFCEVRPFEYSRVPESNDLLHGDSIAVTLNQEVTSPVFVVSHAERLDESGKWLAVAASAKGVAQGYFSKNRGACAWGQLPRLPGGTRANLFIPYHALTLNEGNFTLRYRVQLFTSEAMLFESVSDPIELVVKQHKVLLIKVRETVIYAA